jgi:hypothetical protein
VGATGKRERDRDIIEIHILGEIEENHGNPPS